MKTIWFCFCHSVSVPDMCKYISIIFCSSSFLWSCHHFFWPEDDPSNTEVMFTLKYSWMWYWVKGCCRKSFQLPFLSAKSTTVITFSYIHTHTYKYIYTYISFLNWSQFLEQPHNTNTVLQTSRCFTQIWSTNLRAQSYQLQSDVLFSSTAFSFLFSWFSR